ncbi:hypothetical protein TacPo2_52 [Pantoea bacteriophage TacPo2]
MNWRFLWTIIAVVSVLIGCVVSKASYEVMSASLVGVLFVLGVSFKKPSANLLGALLCGMLAWMSWQAGFFMNAIINLFLLLPMQLIAYATWVTNVTHRTEHKSLVEKVVSKRWWIYTAWLIPLLVAAYFSGSHLWVHDAVTASLVIVATILLMFNVREQWQFWIPYNAIEVFMWFVAASAAPEMLAIMLMRVVFFTNSIIGYFEWRHDGSPRTLLSTETR